MKRYLLLYAVCATALLIYGFRRHRTEVRRLTQNQTALASDIVRYRTRLGEEAASALALRLRCSEFEQLRTADAERIRSLGIRLRRLEAASKTITATTVDLRAPLSESVVRNPNEAFRTNTTSPEGTAHPGSSPDSALGNAPDAFRETVRDTGRLFRWHDAWMTVEGVVTADSAFCRIAGIDTLRQIVHRIPRRFLFIRWGTKALRQEIVSSNPHTRIVYTEYVKIEK